MGASRRPANPDRRRTLSRQQAKQVYDRAARRGAAQDSESRYGGPATEALRDQLRRWKGVGEARTVVEFGCGQGNLAKRLLAAELGGVESYLCVDQSPEMCEAARGRLDERAEVVLSDGDPARAFSSVPDGSVDIVLSTYVLDLLCEDDLCTVVEEAERVLKPAGALALTGLTYGTDGVAALTSSAWELVHRVWPELVGGCRCQRLRDYLSSEAWTEVDRRVVTGGLLTSEVILLQKNP